MNDSRCDDCTWPDCPPCIRDAHQPQAFVTAHAALGIATDVVKEWRDSQNIWRASMPVAAALAAEYQQGRDLAAKVEALADEMDHEDPQVSTWHMARRLRALLAEEAS